MIKAWALRNAPAIVIALALAGSAVAVGDWLIRVGRGQVQPQLDKALAERDNLAATLEFERANAKEQRMPSMVIRKKSPAFAALCATVALCGCASQTPLTCPPPAKPPALLMEPPPPPGAFQERLEAILRPSESSPTNATP